MASSLIIEQESGTWYGRIHPHNGYYAGDFSFARHQSQRAEAHEQLPQHTGRAGHVSGNPQK